MYVSLNILIKNIIKSYNSGFDKDPTSILEIHGSFPTLTLSGKYELTEKVVSDTINRQGHYTFSVGKL